MTEEKVASALAFVGQNYKTHLDNNEPLPEWLMGLIGPAADYQNAKNMESSLPPGLEANHARTASFHLAFVAAWERYLAEQRREVFAQAQEVEFDQLPHCLE